MNFHCTVETPCASGTLHPVFVEAVLVNKKIRLSKVVVNVNEKRQLKYANSNIDSII